MTLGQMLDRAAAALGLDLAAEGVQITPARALDLEAAPPPGSGDVLPWSEQQGIGPYRPTLLPYPLAPTRPALLFGLDLASPSGLRDGLLQRYPASHALTLVGADGQVSTLSLAQAGDLAHGDALLFVPALRPEQNLRSPEGPAWVVTRLLGPGGCPWDVRQTYRSLRPGLLEEVYEVLEALDAGDTAALPEELGDLLLQTLVHAEMARQEQLFDIGDVYGTLAAKLINRHPHVFGQLTVDGSGEVLRNWEAIKGQELAAKGRARTSALDGVPADLPALARAQKLVHKAARVGFDWSSVDDVWRKLDEELGELRAEVAQGDTERTADELGDVLFVLATLARWLKVDAETALREACGKFRRRFDLVEQAARTQGRPLNTMTLAELLELWGAAKLALTP